MATILICELLYGIIMFTIGVYVGRSSIISQLNRAGIFHINTKDPDKDVIQIELTMSVGELVDQKEVVFEVRQDDSQKIHHL